MSLALAPAWLRRVAKSRHADRLILRGSLLTQQWIPERPAADVDHVLVPEGSPAESRAIADEILAIADDEALPPPAHEVIWANTPWPGHRTKFAPGGEAELQVDIGSGDPLAIPPARVEIFGVSLLAVRPEQMLGWKIHGLVELGHGQWKAKDLYDVHLLAKHCALDDAACVASIRLAFASRNYALSLLDRFLYTDQWGRTRGSRRKWEGFRRKWKGATEPPDNLAAVAASVRERIRPLVEAAG